jgi:hypothetical protein
MIDAAKILTHDGRGWALGEFVGDAAIAALIDDEGFELSDPGYRRIEIRLTPPRFDGERWEVANAEGFTFGPLRGTHRPVHAVALINLGRIGRADVPVTPFPPSPQVELHLNPGDLRLRFPKELQ